MKAKRGGERDHAVALDDSESPPGVPRWLKIFAVIAVALLLFAVGAMIIMGGEHGPGRHQHGAQAASNQLGRSSCV